MTTYVFKTQIKKENIVDTIQNFYHYDIIDNNKDNITLGNSDVLIDIDNDYINILLFNDKINISKIRNYLMRDNG